MVKKGFLKKTGCILISLSIILAGWTFMGSTISIAEDGYSGGTYNCSGGTIAATDLSQYISELTDVNSSANLTVQAGGLQGYENLNSVDVRGTLTAGSSAFEGDTSLTSVSCYKMEGADASTFSKCFGITFNIANQSVGSGYYVYDSALYNGSTLVYVPQSVGSTFTVRDGTTTIESGALDDTYITELNFENDGWSKITSIGSQNTWLGSGQSITINAKGAASTDKVVEFFSGKTNVSVITGSTSSKYTVTVIEKFQDINGVEDSTKTKTSSRSFDIGTTGTIAANSYSDYELVSADSSYTVSEGTESVTFIYKATTDNPSDPEDDPTPTPTDQYTINVTETFYNYNDKLEGSRTNATLSGTYKSGATIAAAPYTNYQLTSGNSPYTVTSNGTVTFTYKATAANAVSPISNNSSSSSSGKKYKITVYDVFYDAAGGRVIKTVTRTTDTYNEGDTFGYEVKSYDGYTWFDSENQSGSVYSDRTVKFFYKANNGAVGAPGAKTATGITASQQAQTTNKYVITKGAGQIVSPNNGDVVIVSNGELSRLLYILVDGSVLNSANYTLASGSTILTLKKEYIASLPLGDHAVQFQYDDGYAITGLRLVAAKTTTTVSYKVSSDGSISAGHTKDTTPKTADGFDARYLLCLAIFLLGAGAMLMGRQRKLEMILADREDY